MDDVEALRRVRLISPVLRRDLKGALASHALMESNNEIIPRGLTGQSISSGDIYSVMQNSIALKLSMDIARIFDLSSPKRYPVEEQDKASIQVLAALCDRKGVQEQLELEAAKSFPGIADLSDPNSPHRAVIEATLLSLEASDRDQYRRDCRDAIESFLAVARRVVDISSGENLALRRIREFRDRRLAHALFDKEPDDLPRYNDLSLLLKTAKEAVHYASLAIEGLNAGLDDDVEEYRKRSEDFSSCILHGLIRSL